MERNSFVLKGASAEIRWGWHSAATLRSWEVSSDGTATATVVSHDAFKVSQQPLTFVAHTPAGHQWRWGVESLQIAGDTVRMALAEE